MFIGSESVRYHLFLHGIHSRMCEILPWTLVVPIYSLEISGNFLVFIYLVSINRLFCLLEWFLWFYDHPGAAAKSLQSCPTLCDPIDGSPWGSPVPGILQSRTLEWVAISFSNAWKWKVKVKSLSLVQLLATPWTAAHQAAPSMGFSRQECWSRVPLPSPPYIYGNQQDRCMEKK